MIGVAWTCYFDWCGLHLSCWSLSKSWWVACACSDEVACTWVAETHWDWGHAPAVAWVMSWDGMSVGRVWNTESRECDSSTFRWITHQFWQVWPAPEWWEPIWVEQKGTALGPVMSCDYLDLKKRPGESLNSRKVCSSTVRWFIHQFWHVYPAPEWQKPAGVGVRAQQMGRQGTGTMWAWERILGDGTESRQRCQQGSHPPVLAQMTIFLFCHISDQNN